MAKRKMCIECGEQFQQDGELCFDCANPDRLVVDRILYEDAPVDDAGLRVCDCEDYPCCGH